MIRQNKIKHKENIAYSTVMNIKYVNNKIKFAAPKVGRTFEFFLRQLVVSLCDSRTDKILEKLLDFLNFGG